MKNCCVYLQANTGSHTGMRRILIMTNLVESLTYSTDSNYLRPHKIKAQVLNMNTEYLTNKLMDIEVNYKFFSWKDFLMLQFLHTPKNRLRRDVKHAFDS